MKKIELKFKDIKIGMEVFDKDNDKGIITDCDDINNVFVRFIKIGRNSMGSGNYCLDKKAKEYTPLYIL